MELICGCEGSGDPRLGGDVLLGGARVPGASSIQQMQKLFPGACSAKEENTQLQLGMALVPVG